MNNPAQAILEEVYEYALNPNESYAAQLAPLAANGELSNRASLNKILFKLCEVVDAQAKKIKLLEDDRVAIAQKMTELEGKDGDISTATNTPAPSLEAEQPITNTQDTPTSPITDATAPDPTKPITDNNL